MTFDKTLWKLFLKTDIQTHRHTDKQKDIQTGRNTDRQTDGHTDRHTYGQKDRHTDRQTDKLTESCKFARSPATIVGGNMNFLQVALEHLELI